MCRENLFEAEMALGLARHLLLQGYLPEDVTILCACESSVFQHL